MTHRDRGESLSKADKSILGLLLGALVTAGVPLIGFQWHQSVKMTAAMTSVSEVKDSVDRLTDTVAQLIREDVSDIKARMLVMEQKQILPRAEKELSEINQRLRVLEQNR